MAQTKRKPKNDYRRVLLAKVHIAKKDLGVDEDVYRMILREEFGVDSAADLANRELEQLVVRFESRGWKAKSGQASRQGGTHTGDKVRGQVDALKERIGQELLHSELNEKRLRGLVRKVCKADDLRFCHNAGDLKRLLAIIRRINDGQ